MTPINSSVPLLTKILANLVVLSMKTRNAHWNVVGHDFRPMHAFFEELYNDIDPAIDAVAERIRAIGEPAPGQLAALLSLATLKEQPSLLQPALELVAELLKDYISVIAELRQDIQASESSHDIGTASLLSDLLRKFEKSAWMLSVT